MNDIILVRIVQLTLHPQKTKEFLVLFDSASPHIRAFEGCEHLELLQNSIYPNMVTTYSHWQSKESLEHYRKSELFISTWAKTKALFAAPPKATSYTLIRQLT